MSDERAVDQMFEMHPPGKGRFRLPNLFHRKRTLMDHEVSPNQKERRRSALSRATEETADLSASSLLSDLTGLRLSNNSDHDTNALDVNKPHQYSLDLEIESTDEEDIQENGQDEYERGGEEHREGLARTDSRREPLWWEQLTLLDPATEIPRTTPGVAFSTIEIREYGRCMGDNPSVMHGIPLALGWNVEQTRCYRISDYETMRPRRRTLLELRRTPAEREDILRESGFSRGEIREMIEKVAVWRAHREKTIQGLHGTRYGKFGQYVASRVLSSLSMSPTDPVIPEGKQYVHPRDPDLPSLLPEAL